MSGDNAFFQREKKILVDLLEKSKTDVVTFARMVPVLLGHLLVEPKAHDFQRALSEPCAQAERICLSLVGLKIGLHLKVSFDIQHHWKKIWCYCQLIFEEVIEKEPLTAVGSIYKENVTTALVTFLTNLIIDLMDSDDEDVEEYSGIIFGTPGIKPMLISLWLSAARLQSPHLSIISNALPALCQPTCMTPADLPSQALNAGSDIVALCSAQIRTALARRKLNIHLIYGPVYLLHNIVRYPDFTSLVFKNRVASAVSEIVARLVDTSTRWREDLVMEEQNIIVTPLPDKIRNALLHCSSILNHLMQFSEATVIDALNARLLESIVHIPSLEDGSEYGWHEIVDTITIRTVHLSVLHRVSGSLRRVVTLPVSGPLLSASWSQLQTMTTSRMTYRNFFLSTRVPGLCSSYACPNPKQYPPNMKQCSSCLNAYYCSKSCQKTAWRFEGHINDCISAREVLAAGYGIKVSASFTTQYIALVVGTELPGLLANLWDQIERTKRCIIEIDYRVLPPAVALISSKEFLQEAARKEKLRMPNIYMLDISEDSEDDDPFREKSPADFLKVTKHIWAEGAMAQVYAIMPASHPFPLDPFFGQLTANRGFTGLF
ncbi:hypothetical protein C8J56DRAFT_984326 [Mycena floridula]|nr:hypothetical protein C8J56DRAFT_984326 [Mycena floridula]